MFRAILFLLVCLVARATIIDRVAVVIGKRAIKESDIMRDVHITSFLNGDKLDFSAAARKAAANRLIDQQLIRTEMETGRYPTPAPKEAEELLAQIRKQRFRNEADYRRALKNYALTEQELLAHLRWQITALRFVDLRFRPGVLVSDEDIREYYEQHASELRRNNSKPDAGFNDFKTQIQETLTGERVNEEFYAWLDQSRKQTRLEYRENDLQ